MGVLDVAAGLVGEAFEHVLVFVGEAEGHGADAIDGHQVALGEFENLFQCVRAGVIVPIADDDDDAARFVGFAFDQFAAGDGEINGIEQRSAAAGLHLAHLIDDLIGIPGGVLGDFGGIGVGDEVAGIALVAGKQIPDHLQNGVLVDLPVNTRVVAEIDQEAGDDGLLFGVAEETDVLRAAFIENAAILLDAGDD